ncbi:MAG TPA: T9SS type A sorting domain-containing protein, partial [Bacteroidota bacterium]|nr:T9SS type A sorting domain-containing protein [Bacteroidota bacterium]
EEKNYVLKANQVPVQYRLYQNYPNPFNPVTVIKYQVPVPSKVTLRIYNILGQEVVNLVDEIQDEGFMSVEWNSLNGDGRMVASGVYFYRLEAKSIAETNRLFRETGKMLLLR